MPICGFLNYGYLHTKIPTKNVIACFYLSHFDIETQSHYKVESY